MRVRLYIEDGRDRSCRWVAGWEKTDCASWVGQHRWTVGAGNEEPEKTDEPVRMPLQGESGRLDLLCGAEERREYGTCARNPRRVDVALQPAAPRLLLRSTPLLQYP